MNSALKHGNTTLKRFVLTSSTAAVREPTTVSRIFTENDWNNAAVEAVKTRGSEAGPVAIYLASKTLAEKAAWDFVAAHKSEISWDLVVLNPPYIFGARLSLYRLSSVTESSTLAYSHHSVPRRQLMTSTLLCVKSMTHSPVRGRVRNCKARQAGCMLRSSRRHMFVPRMQRLLVANASSSDQAPSFTKIFVSSLIPLLSSFKLEPDVM